MPATRSHHYGRNHQSCSVTARDVLHEIDERHRQRLQEVQERRTQRNTQPSAPIDQSAVLTEIPSENNNPTTAHVQTDLEVIAAQQSNEATTARFVFPAESTRQQRAENQSNYPVVNEILQSIDERHRQRTEMLNRVQTERQVAQLSIALNLRENDGEISESEFNRAQPWNRHLAESTRQQREDNRSRYPVVNEILQRIDEEHRQRTEILNRSQTARHLDQVSAPTSIWENDLHDTESEASQTQPQRRQLHTSRYPVVSEILQTIDERQNQRINAASRRVFQSAQLTNELLDLPPSFTAVTQIGLYSQNINGREDLPPSYEEAVRNMRGSRDPIF